MEENEMLKVEYTLILFGWAFLIGAFIVEYYKKPLLNIWAYPALLLFVIAVVLGFIRRKKYPEVQDEGIKN